MTKNKLLKIKRRLTRYKTIVRGVLLGSIMGVFLLSLYLSLPPVLGIIRKLTKGPAATLSLVRNPQEVLKKTNSRTNILLLGMGGSNHEGAELTDSIVVVSVNLNTTDTVLLSIPRDIWIDSLKTKINATYYYGEQKRSGGGPILTKAAVEEVIGQPIHYVVTVDFDGFKNAIDLVDGVEIDVPAAFDDYKYPIPGMEDAEPEELRYEHLHFDAGVQTLSGERALKYVRSRNAEGDQGTDFARSKRQQQVLLTFKDKVLSKQVLLSPTKLKELAETFNRSVSTDLQEPEYLALAKLALKAKDGNAKTATLEATTEQEEGLLIHPPQHLYDNQWVLIGRDESWDEIHDYVNQLFYADEPS